MPIRRLFFSSFLPRLISFLVFLVAFSHLVSSPYVLAASPRPVVMLSRTSSRSTRSRLLILSSAPSCLSLSRRRPLIPSSLCPTHLFVPPLLVSPFLVPKSGSSCSHPLFSSLV
jgi:hypothetical protein